MGILLLTFSTCMALLQVALPGSTWFMHKEWSVRLVKTLVALIAFSTGTAFFYLVYLFVTSDLSFLNVALNSHQATEVIYKVSGVWGNHEGSMLLWLVLLSTVSTVVALQTNLSGRFHVQVLRVLGGVSLSFHLFVLLLSNPFVQLGQRPRQGMGLNPLLEDPSLAIHPPVLFTGLALLSVLYAFGCAALKTDGVNREFVQPLRSWALTCWLFLTLGIALGSWWAYYELGWGGWWFWDPVENLSLLPWLVVTGLLHALAMGSDGGSRTVPFLSILAFTLALLSFFLVRSGVLSSVHAFAVDPMRGGSLGLIATVFTFYGVWRLLRYKSEAIEPPHILSRQAFLKLNTYLVLGLVAVILIGTIYPLVLMKLNGPVISVGAPYFTMTTTPFIVALLILMLLVPFVGRGMLRQISYLGTGLMAVLVILLYIRSGWPVFAAAVLSLAVVMLITTGWDVLRRKSHLTVKHIAMSLAHAGVAIAICGAVIDSFDKTEVTQPLRLNTPIGFHGFQLSLKEIEDIRAPYFQRQVAHLSVANGNDSFMLYPEKRFYPLHEMITSETAIKAVGLGDLYAVLSSADEGMWLVKLHWHPAIRLLWIGALMMVLAAFIAVVGSVKRKRSV